MALVLEKEITQEITILNGWVETTLEKIVLPTRPKVQPSKDSTLPFVGMDSIQPHSLTISSLGKFSDMKSSGVYFTPGDVLYGKMRPYLNKVHKAEFEGACSAEFLVFPQHDNLDSDFLKYLLHQRDFVNFVTPKSSGDRPRIDLADIADYQVLLPPYNEQKRIVSKIEELFSQLDDGEAALKRAQKLVEQYRQSVLKAAVTGELTQDWREKNKHQIESGEALLQRILNARRDAWEQAELAKLQAKGKAPKDDNWKNKYPKPKASDTSNLPELPEDWVWASMDQLLINIEAGKNFKCEERPPRDGEVGIVKVSAVTWGTFDEEESKTITDSGRIRLDYRINPGDFLFSRANTIELVGACLIVSTTRKCLLLSDKILRFVFVESLLKQWVDLCLKSRLGRDQIESLATGNQDSMRNISQDKIRKINIPIPPIEEVLKICSDYVAELSKIQFMKEQRVSELKRTKALKQSILKSAFSGQLVPQDPNDEPASELLQRIALERSYKSSDKPQKPQRKSKRTEE